MQDFFSNMLTNSGVQVRGNKLGLFYAFISCYLFQYCSGSLWASAQRARVNSLYVFFSIRVLYFCTYPYIKMRC
ncbi:hypothetical protein GLOIN_2v1697089 [Rhizophagus irregularis DAOM 181602=DAOM 197198]|uniref:Uncharacterized protein n=1 Tax=Rhizophagus irregularis (strain DAOM 181602 / DAOM 197198 / MUCL 43194) TaxID=747089 RepID=A0A2P4PAC7_RHIID|nr:hypothetical protein GLOIN_2v1697089 [Rhizophagus irregularis DAOM 181602=DAOM 197198]POG62349.1 hypothetical protein GLOIN_2v1697089 [Rhizophagus irregularis DAOM 181602=DAOM 197198]|eukprot:XP_025169215.1 hypothetical protein GLOIN_2v1697089 [Rhizophagus irregularis DAOM 181602=DAOM 197198]